MARNTWRPVPFAEVTIDDHFWAPRMRTIREQTIPYQYAQLEETERVDALYRRSPADVTPCPFTAIPYYAWANRSPGRMRVWLREAPAG